MRVEQCEVPAERRERPEAVLGHRSDTSPLPGEVRVAECRRLPGPACLLERQGQAVLRKPEVLVVAPQGLLDELEVLAKEGDRLGVLAELGQRPPEVPEAVGAVGMPAAEVFGQDGEAPARELLRLVGSPAAIEHHSEPREGLGEVEAILAVAPAEDLHRLPVERLRAGIVPPVCQELGEADPRQAPGPLPSDAAPPELDRRVKESLGLVARLPHAEDGGEMLERDRPLRPRRLRPVGQHRQGGAGDRLGGLGAVGEHEQRRQDIHAGRRARTPAESRVVEGGAGGRLGLVEPAGVDQRDGEHVQVGLLVRIAEAALLAQRERPAAGGHRSLDVAGGRELVGRPAQGVGIGKQRGT